MDETLIEWKQLKDRSAKLIEKLKQPFFIGFACAV